MVYENVEGALSAAVDVINVHSNKILQMQGEALIHRTIIRRLMSLLLVNDEELAKVWNDSIAGDTEFWKTELEDCSPATRTQIEAGIAEIERFRAEYSDESDSRPRFSVIDGGKPNE
ncbi:hypothetical protein [Pararhizobium arenae]|uniref:hypothetical protein n=1 Tax=Pararhizobium arenae TaxID=1856850 RepID=UPI00094B2391|nr:hypothetical protein [Pararhizobium arenae]